MSVVKHCLRVITWLRKITFLSSVTDKCKKSKVKETQVKVKLSVQCHNGIWGCVGIAPFILTPVLAGGKWSASCPLQFIFSERAVQYALIGGLGCQTPEVVCTSCRGKKICCLYQELNHDFCNSVCILVIVPTMLSWFATHDSKFKKNG
jgi:hypothetical protein